jgi:hypothetical protein
MASGFRRPSVAPPAVSASPVVNEKGSKSRLSDIADGPPEQEAKKTRTLAYRATSNLSVRSTSSKSSPKKDGITGTGAPIINIAATDNKLPKTDDGLGDDARFADALANELDFVTVTAADSIPQPRAPDKASRLLGIRYRRSMEPIPASGRNSIMSTRSARDPPPSPSFIPTLPLTSLYVVSGLPKSPHTWTLADPDSVLGLHHSEGAVSRWWRPEVLGSTVSPGCGGGKKKKKGKGESEVMKGAGALTKQEVGKMLSKALKACSSAFSYSHNTLNASLLFSCPLLAKLKSLPRLYNPHPPFTLSHLLFPRRTPLWLHLLLEISFVPPCSQAQIIVLQLPHSLTPTKVTLSYVQARHIWAPLACLVMELLPVLPEPQR